MEFFIVNNSNFNTHKISTDSVPVDWMVTGFKKLAKDFPTMDKTDGFYFTFVDEPVKVDSIPENSFQYKITKGLQLVVAPHNETITLSMNNTSRYFSANELTMQASDTPSTIKDPHYPTNLTAQEMLAIDWLKTGQTGVSSKTMCFKLFPKVKKYYDDTKSSPFNFESDVPYDNADFNRCMLFANAVNLYPDQLEKVGKINNKWGKIIENWDTLTDLVKKADEESLKQSYYLIKECIDVPARTKKPKM